MSAGAFVRARYETNTGVLVGIRLQEETTQALLGGAINSGPTGVAAAGYPSAVVSRSRRGIGIHPRTVTLKFATSTPPTGYKADQTYTIPVLSESVWDGLADGSAITYLGSASTFISKAPEIIK